MYPLRSFPIFIVPIMKVNYVMKVITLLNITCTNIIIHLSCIFICLYYLANLLAKLHKAISFNFVVTWNCISIVLFLSSPSWGLLVIANVNKFCIYYPFSIYKIENEWSNKICINIFFYCFFFCGHCHSVEGCYSTMGIKTAIGYRINKESTVQVNNMWTNWKYMQPQS